MTKHLSLVVLVLVVGSGLLIILPYKSSATPAAVEWKAQELCAYLTYMQDGHSGIGDSDVVFLDRARVSDRTIERALEYKKEVEDSKRKFIADMKALRKE